MIIKHKQLLIISVFLLHKTHVNNLKIHKKNRLISKLINETT